LCTSFHRDKKVVGVLYVHCATSSNRSIIKVSYYLKICRGAEVVIGSLCKGVLDGLDSTQVPLFTELDRENP
jgi:hypothetical protein